MTSWTRATTLASTLSDRYALERWGNRNVVLGIAARPDLYALAASCTPEDKDQLGAIVDQAQEAAKARSGANLGTALHRLTERIDRGEILDVPADWRPDIDAYCKTLADASISILPEWIERVVINPVVESAGTIDRLAYLDGRFIIADLKTGKHAVDRQMTDISVQLAIYANATHAWKGDAGQVPRDQWGRYKLPHPDEDPEVYEPLPAVDTTKALVIHLPVGEATCTLHEVDITAGREAIDLALAVRKWRKRDDLSTPYSQWKELATVTQISSSYEW